MTSKAIVEAKNPVIVPDNAILDSRSLISRTTE